MPISRMDIMTMAPKTQEVTSVKVAQNEKPMNDQRMIENQFQNNTIQNSMKPVKTTQSENPEYRYDAKEKGNNEYDQKQKKKKKKDGLNGNPEVKGYVGPNHIDITI